MPLFLFTGVVTCQHPHAEGVRQALMDVLDSPHVERHTPLQLRALLHHTQVKFDAALSGNEKLIALLTEAVKDAHPQVHRIGGELKAQLLADISRFSTEKKQRPNGQWLSDADLEALRLKGSEPWLPEISIAMVTSDDTSARAIFDYWQALPHNH